MAVRNIVAVVGSGNMGAGIAQKIAMSGFSVLLADVDLERAATGMGHIERSLDEAVERRVLDRAAADEALARVTPVGDLDRLADADLVIEAVFEDLLVKKDLFRQLDTLCKESCVLATNTSSFYVHEMASVTRRPGHVVGLHYFFHPAKNRLLEIIPGPLTRPEVRADMERFAAAHGKTAIHTTDSPGFAVNRFFVPWLNEAVRLLEEGAADIASIDAAAKAAFGIGMGPFELMNLTGIAIALHAAGTLGTELGAFYEPADRLHEQVDSGEPWDLSGDADPAAADLVGARLLGVTYAVAGALIDEGVCTREDVDRGARIGLRWALGPFEMMNRTGVGEALALCERLAEHHPDLTLPDCLAERAESGEPWTFRRVDLSVTDGVATITINRPEVLNALDEEVVEQLGSRLDEALATPGLRAIILAGAGKAFVAGADLRFFVENIEANAIERIVRFTERGQELLRRIETAPVPVIARVHGMALGGGVELALACHAIICSTAAFFALPETGLGIYPGLGGTQRLPRIVGSALARRLILTGRRLSARDAVQAGLALEAVPPEELDEAIAHWVEQGIPDRYAGQIPTDAATAEAYDPANLQDLLQGTLPEGLSAAAAALLARDLRAIGRKAPVALKEAARLLDEGAGLDLASALRLELDALPAIFGTHDALLGLKAVGSRTPPEWTGA
jgi:enoyl-CoA hydratase/3-hydroxyacyl-CoA dehydrogenase